MVKPATEKVQEVQIFGHVNIGKLKLDIYNVQVVC